MTSQNKNSKPVTILDVGSGPNSVAETVFDFIENKQIIRLDGSENANPDVLHDITEPLPDNLRNHFDIVYVSHVLEHIDIMKVIETFRNVTGAMRNMGEIWVVVPSMEWAANEIMAQREGMGVQAAIFGGQKDELDFHRCGFTLRSLRQMVELCGLIPRKAYQSPYQISFDGKLHNCIQNIVIAIRYDGLQGDPGDAIQPDISADKS